MKKNEIFKSIILLLDHNFGSLRLVRGKRSEILAGIDLTLGTAEALKQFKEAGTQTILVVPEPLKRQTLKVLGQFLPEVDKIIPQKKDLSATIASCTSQFSIDLQRTVFVAADRVDRNLATKQGSLAVPHPVIATLIIRGHSLQFARVIGEREHFIRIPEVIPYYAEYTEHGSWNLLAVMSREAIAEILKLRLHVEVLPLDLATEDPLFIRLDAINEVVTEELTKQKILFAEGKQMLIALRPDQHNDSLAIHGPHGHFQFLMPSLELLQTAPESSITFQSARLTLGQWPVEKFKVMRIPSSILEVLLGPCPSTTASFQADVDRYSGVSNLDAAGTIVSRHIRHPDNQRVVQALLDELNSLGYCAYTHSFKFDGLTLNNVVADLPGTGFFRFQPDILERVRKIFLKYPLPDPPGPWIRLIRQLVGNEWLKEQKLDNLPPLKLRNSLERIFALKAWFPWWLQFCKLPGLGSQIVIVGCHLDSTAANTSGYNPIADPAPGADDDASGIAATLSLARYFTRFRGKLPHTVRFCFFNAEESGLVGSKAYAAMLKATGAPLKAVVCMDMIGYNSDLQRIFEIHAGYTDPSIRDLNLPIADKIAAWAACLGALAPAQIYKGTIDVAGTDRSIYDGAINRSDHGAFHQQGYPAVVVSEDFFVNLATEPGADPNPNYHRETDTVIDSAYGADITCAIAYAVKEIVSG